MRKKTVQEKGINYASELILQNVRDLKTILEWNVANNISFFRMSSEIFPWASEYALEDLPDFQAVEEILFDCGLYAEEHGIRLTMHPGPFNKFVRRTSKLFSILFAILRSMVVLWTCCANQAHRKLN